VSQESRDSRTVRWLVALAALLGGAVATLAVLLARQGGGEAVAAASPASATTAAPASVPPSPPPAPAPGAAPAPPSAPAPGAPATPPSAPAPAPDPFGPLLGSLGSLFDDPAIEKRLRDLGRSLQDLIPAPGKKPRGPFDLLDQLLGRAFGGGEPRLTRIEATLHDRGDAYEVRCRFPREAPETATFEVRGQSVVIKARFPRGGPEERSVDLPGPVRPEGARSSLTRGELVVTVPKAR
jgi:HSP20 family molecular chaperone IbpA